jgi:translation initiation factor IF-3
MPTAQAQALADEEGYDLVEISPTSRPPVCRIMDFGKYKYELNKRQKESKKKQHVIQVKEVKFRPKTEEHDYQFKTKHAIEFLKKNNKVKFTVVFRGRELSHKEMGFKILARVVADLAEFGIVEKPAGFEGRLMVMIMAPTAIIKELSKEKPAEIPKEIPAEKPAEQPAPEQDSMPDAAEAETPAKDTEESKKEGNDAETEVE